MMMNEALQEFSTVDGGYRGVQHRGVEPRDWLEGWQTSATGVTSSLTTRLYDTN